jgi:nitroreductase
MNDIKRATTKYPVLDIIKNRWSPRSFYDKTISEEDINTIIEAATWSFSAMNEQPWRYVVAHKGTVLFNAFLELLYPGNKPWNTQAAVLVLSLRKTTYAGTGKINAIALHDVGAANILLSLQANSMGIYTHVIEGYSKEAAKELLALDESLEPVVMIALGYPGAAEKLEEPFKARELLPRSRKDLTEIVLNPHLN